MMSAQIILLLCVFVCHQGTITSQTTPEPFCVYNNVIYQVGPIPTSDPCQTCECPYWGGDAECYWQTCTTCASSEDAISKPGQCCPECQPKACTDAPPQVCEYNGQIHAFNSIFRIGTCKSGYCALHGQVLLVSECCEYQGKTYELSSGFKINLCTLGYCESDGNVTIAETCCDHVTCPNPVHVEDECCPRCPNDSVPHCTFKGQTYGIDSTFQADSCQQAYCDPNGELVFSPPTCCEFENKTYELNSEFVSSLNNCVLGHCGGDGEVSTFGTDCYWCDNPIYVEGQCCPVCDFDSTTTSPLPTTTSGCDYNGQIIELNTDFTMPLCSTWGHCGSDGQVYVEGDKCPHCDFPIEIGGQCCPECGDYPENFPPICLVDGKFYDMYVGPIKSKDPCLNCECVPEGGEAVCTSVDCEQCTDYEIESYRYDECCPICEPIVCADGEQIYQPGPVPSTDPCETCECPESGGDLMCYQEPCPPCPDWADNYPEPGQCCPTCQNSPRP